MALTLHIDLIIAAFINLRSFGIKSVSYYVNSIIALAVIIFYGVLIVKVFLQSFKIEKLRAKIIEQAKAIEGKAENSQLDNESSKGTLNDQDDKANKLAEIDNPWSFLKEHTKNDNHELLSGVIDQIMVAKDFFIAFFIIIFVNNPYL
jgi:predicted Holliday junction resolvase-like endonuclease